MNLTGRGALAAGALSLAVVQLVAAAEPETEILLRPLTSFWQHLEEGPFAGPRGIFYDRTRDEVWVADTMNHRVAVFTRDGLPIFTTTPGAEVREPTRLVVDPSGRILVLDNDRSRVAVLDWRGRYVGPLPLAGLAERPSIGALELDGDGNLYVGDNAAGEIVVFTPELRVRQRFGRTGTGNGEFQSIADIAVDAERIVVVDHQAIPVQVFDRNGNFEVGFGAHEMGEENFSLPEAAVFDGFGRLVVVDALRHEVKLFTPEGRFLGRFGGYGSAPGNVAGPADVATDGKGWIYVAERSGSRVQLFEELERPLPPERRRTRRVRPPGR